MGGYDRQWKEKADSPDPRRPYPEGRPDEDRVTTDLNYLYDYFYERQDKQDYAEYNKKNRCQQAHRILKAIIDVFSHNPFIIDNTDHAYEDDRQQYAVQYLGPDRYGDERCAGDHYNDDRYKKYG